MLTDRRWVMSVALWPSNLLLKWYMSARFPREPRLALGCDLTVTFAVYHPWLSVLNSTLAIWGIFLSAQILAMFCDDDKSCRLITSRTFWIGYFVPSIIAWADSNIGWKKLQWGIEWKSFRPFQTLSRRSEPESFDKTNISFNKFSAWYRTSVTLEKAMLLVLFLWTRCRPFTTSKQWNHCASERLCYPQHTGRFVVGTLPSTLRVVFPSVLGKTLGWGEAR
jgi:hypothetical protein